VHSGLNAQPLRPQGRPLTGRPRRSPADAFERHARRQGTIRHPVLPTMRSRPAEQAQIRDSGDDESGQSHRIRTRRRRDLFPRHRPSQSYINDSLGHTMTESDSRVSDYESGRQQRDCEKTATHKVHRGSPQTMFQAEKFIVPTAFSCTELRKRHTQTEESDRRPNLRSTDAGQQIPHSCP